jgi:hypothetical protein
MNSSGKRCSKIVHLCNDGCKKWCASAQNCIWINKGEKVWCEHCCKIGGYDFPSDEELVRNVSCHAHMAVVHPPSGGETDEFIVVGNVGGGTPPPEPASRNNRPPQRQVIVKHGAPGLLIDAIPDAIRRQLGDSEQAIHDLHAGMRELRDRVRHSENMITELHERLQESESQREKWCARVQDLEMELGNEKDDRRQLWVVVNRNFQAAKDAAWSYH